METIKELGPAIQQIGFPVVLILLLCYAGWRAFIWTGKEVIKPVVAKHLNFLDKVTENVESNTEANKSIKAGLDATLQAVESNKCRYQPTSGS